MTCHSSIEEYVRQEIAKDPDGLTLLRMRVRGKVRTVKNGKAKITKPSEKENRAWMEMLEESLDMLSLTQDERKANKGTIVAKNNKVA